MCPDSYFVPFPPLRLPIPTPSLAYHHPRQCGWPDKRPHMNGALYLVTLGDFAGLRFCLSRPCCFIWWSGFKDVFVISVVMLGVALSSSLGFCPDAFSHDAFFELVFTPLLSTDSAVSSKKSLLFVISYCLRSCAQYSLLAVGAGMVLVHCTPSDSFR